MRSSSDGYDYTPYLPNNAPEYLREWAEQRTWPLNVLIWKVGSWTEPLTGLKQRCARVTCTACGNTYLLDYEPGCACHGVGFGPRLRIQGNITGERETTKCPECGAKVIAEHIHGSGEYASEYAWPMTLDRIKIQGRTDRLTVILWEVHKYHDADGRRSISIRPFEAYIVEEKNIVRCTKHARFMYSVYETEWRQTVRFSDTMKDIYEVVCPEGIEAAVKGTTAENAKLEIYLNGRVPVFPVSWLRIWQKHKNAETLMTCGASEVIAVLIGQEKVEIRRGYREEYGTAIPLLKEIDWKEKRPSRMLHMNRGELREAVKLQKSEALGGKTWRIWLHARQIGHAWGLEELQAIEKLKRTDRLEESIERPSKIIGYLTAQRRRREDDGADESMLYDYWRMARHFGLDMTDTEIRWPERLRREHDRLALRQTAEKNAAEAAKYRDISIRIGERAKKLAYLEFHSGGLFIRPTASRDELVAEGKMLHHCVGGYASSVAEGRTAILFIRREDEPDMPFYTLEFNEKSGSVMQNRGSRNCDRTPEVKAFEDEWLSWVRSGCPKITKEVKTA